jgi:crossover junction endodeoxyribonuclease RuvC
MIFVGIDPGLSGALAFYDPNTPKFDVHDMPTMKRKNSNREEIDVYQLALLFDTTYKNIQCAVIEDVGAMTYTDASGRKRGQGAASSFAFGKAAGTIIGVLGAFYIQIYPVKPSVWKAILGLSSNKDQSRYKAMELFPAAKDQFQRKRDDGKAEASLLAYLGSTRFR